MSTYNFNTDNLSGITVNPLSTSGTVDQAGYINLQQAVFNQSSYPTVPDVTQMLQPLSQNANPSLATEAVTPITIPGTSLVEDVNLLSAQASGTPISGSINYTFPSASAAQSQGVVRFIWEDTSGANEAGTWQVLGIQPPSLSAIESIYTTYASDISSGAWANESYWLNNGLFVPTDINLYNFYEFYQALWNSTNGQDSEQTPAFPPPTTLAGFLALIAKGKVWDGSVPAGWSAYNSPQDPNAPFPGPYLNDTGTGLTGSTLNSSIPTVLTSLLGVASSGIGYSNDPTPNYMGLFINSYITGLNSDSSPPATATDFTNDLLNYLSSPVDLSTLNLPSSDQSLQGSVVLYDSNNQAPPITLNYTLPSYTSGQTVITPLASGYNSSTVASSISNAFYTMFDQSYQASGGDSSAALQAVGETTLFNNTFQAFMQALGQGAFNVTDLQSLYTAWSQFLGPSIALTSTLGSAGLTNYQQIYDTFFPNSNPNDFYNLLNAFVTQFTQSSGGVFNSSLMADQWYATVQNTFMLSKGLSVTDSQPLKETNFTETKVILALYSLLITMLGDLQKLTAAQANYDNFLVKWEGAYTNEIASIPDNLIGGTIPGGVNLSTTLTTNAISVQSSLESQIATATQKWTSNLTSFNTEVSNQEKAQTTTISQSNEASNQQSNLLNAILQELQSLLQSIWR